SSPGRTFGSICARSTPQGPITASRGSALAQAASARKARAAGTRRGSKACIGVSSRGHGRRTPNVARPSRAARTESCAAHGRTGDEMPQNVLERRILWATRLLTLAAVVASIAGALLMFYLGVANTIEAFRIALTGAPGTGAGLPDDEATVIALMDALDRFLIGMVLLFFGYGVYGLFIRPDLRARDIGLPDWIHVERIGQLKQTLAEVIIVVLFVLFLRVALQTFHAGGAAMTWTGMGRFLMLPVAIVLLAAGLRLVQLHPKETTPPELSKI